MYQPPKYIISIFFVSRNWTAVTASFVIWIYVLFSFLVSCFLRWFQEVVKYQRFSFDLLHHFPKENHLQFQFVLRSKLIPSIRTNTIYLYNAHFRNYTVQDISLKKGKRISKFKLSWEKVMVEPDSMIVLVGVDDLNLINFN